MEKETDIQRAICDYLALRKYMFWRNNNIPVYDAVGKKFRAMPKYTMRGRPDIEIISGGHYIGLEVKVLKGKQTDSQIDFEVGCKRAGGSYFVVRSLEQVMKIL